MQNINDLRSEIDKIDDEVLKRLNERMNFVRRAKANQRQCDLPPRARKSYPKPP